MVDDEDLDAAFASVVDGIELDMPADVEDYAALNDLDLSKRYKEAQDRLHALPQGQLLRPNTPEAHEALSIYSAVLFEMKRRWR